MVVLNIRYTGSSRSPV